MGKKPHLKKKKKNPENEVPFILMVSLDLCLQTFGFLFGYS